MHYVNKHKGRHGPPPLTRSIYPNPYQSRLFRPE